MHLRAHATKLAGCVLAVVASVSVSAQTPSAQRQAPFVPSRVVTAVDDAQRTTLRGNTHPLARSRFEAGRVSSSLQMERITLVLQRSPEQEAALKAFNERQYDPKSPDYHHWLEPEEFGRLYGPSDADIAAVTNWLQLRGFQIYDVNKGRTMVQFSGTAAQVEQAFQLEMHRYNFNGEQHIANDRDPSIPEALSPVILGIASLHNFFVKPQHVLGKPVWFDPRTGRKMLASSQTPSENTDAPQPAATLPAKTGGASSQLVYTNNYSLTREDVTPYDIATIYNILPLWQASTPINGTGVNIAISGVSDIKQADVNTFRSAFGLPAMTLQTVVNGIDPGTDTKYGGAQENTLDVEMAGATAPGAQIILVVSADTATTGADMLSDEYIIDNKTAPIMSASYGGCELSLGTAGNAAYNTLWQQGMTQGISIFESAGDQGSAGCADQDINPPNADTGGLQVNGLASSPYVTAVGGTDFTWSFVNNGISTYWNSSNGAQFQTAKGIMPEVPWNSTCTNTLLVQAFGENSGEQLCNLAPASSLYSGIVSIGAGSGGTSNCTQPTGTTPATCAGGYTKPTWQTGYGASTTNRDVPDVSLFASFGFPTEAIDASGLLYCYSGYDACNYTLSGLIEAQEIGGTSASSPMMAGIMALVVQKTNSSQGLANPVLYQLYGSQVTAGTSCNSSTVANGNNCVFYDVTQGTNAQVCITGDPNCVTNTNGDKYGVLSGFNAGAGYDDAVGLGTLNVTNLVNAWPATTTPPALTYTLSISTTGLTFPSTAATAISAAQNVTIQNTGTGTVTLNSETLTGTNASSFLISANTCTGTLATTASCTVSIEFTPSTTGPLSVSLTITDTATGSPQSVTLSGTATAAPAASVNLSTTSLTFNSQTVSTASASQPITLSAESDGL